MIDKEMSDNFLKKYMHKITKNNCKGAIKSNILFFVISEIMLMFSKNFIISGIYAFVAIAITGYSFYKIRRDWNFVTGTFISMTGILWIIISVNLIFYEMSLLMNIFDMTIFIFTIVYEIVLLIFTYLCTLKSIEKKKKYKIKRYTSLAITASGTTAYMWYLIMKHYVSNFSVQIQGTVMGVTFIVSISILIIALGSNCIPNYILIRKFGFTQQVEENMQ